MLKVVLICLFICFLALPLFAQGVDTAWVRRYNGPGNSDDTAFAMAIDGSGNVYVTGASFTTETSNDYATIKYYPNGDTAWVRRYNGPANSDDVAYAIAVDVSGNVYVTGGSLGSAMRDYATIKYYPNGDTAWVRRYNGWAGVNDVAYAIAIDISDNVYVTGESGGGSNFPDYATIKYYPNGDTAWVRRYARSFRDIANAIAVDSSGNVYVTGMSESGSTYNDYTTIKYYPNGDTAWVRRYNGPANSNDGASAIAVDSSGNIYVTGYSWETVGAPSHATIKYYPNGDTAWVRRYSPADVHAAIAVDRSGNVCVVGDYVTIKYHPNGDTAWVRRFHGLALSIDGSSNVYMTGGSGLHQFEDYATIKYGPNGDTTWVKTYNGSGNARDEAKAMAIDDSGNVYVTGASFGSGTSYDYATIKYVFIPSRHGDANGDGKFMVSDVIYIINYLFKGGMPPNPLWTADANCDGSVSVSDVIYLINYLFKGGPPPPC